MHIEASSFLEAYRDAFNRCDACAVTDHYALPCIYSQSDRPSVFADREALLDNNTRLVEFYRADDFVRTEFGDVALHGFGDRHALIDVEWTVHRRAPKEVARFRTAYNLRRFDGAWKIWAVTVYEERQAFALGTGPTSSRES
jgi:ketosteroid isomerase-like protein